jgi:hypothetical protein
MGVFICWSGDRSKAIADALKTLLQGILSTQVPIFLSEDIDKGAEWFQAVRTGLNSSLAGIVVLTHENIRSPWMHFEAGALAMSLGADPAVETNLSASAAVAGSGMERLSAIETPGVMAALSSVAPPADGFRRKSIFPLLHAVNAGEITGPLAAYQSTSTTRADMGRLVGALAGIFAITLPQHEACEFVIPKDAWTPFERTLKTVTAPLAKVIPDFESLFQRKTFEEAFHQCTSQDWLGRYEAARMTRERLKEHEDLVAAACPQHEQGLFQMLLADLDVYAMAIEALLITPKDFNLGTDGELAMDSGTRTCCENHRLAIKSVSMRLRHPLDPPLTTAAIRFMAAGTHEERRAIVHRVEGRIRWCREIAYESALPKGEAERKAIDDLMNETSYGHDDDEDARLLPKPEPVLQCSKPDRLMTFRASSWDLDRIFYYRLVYYFEAAAFRWPDAAPDSTASPGGQSSTVVAPMEHDLLCAARDVEMECERYRARSKGGSLMPLIYALDALQGLHPHEHKTEQVERAVSRSIQVVRTELGPLTDPDKSAAIERLLGNI